MSFLAAIPIIGKFFETASELVDNVSTTDEERLEAKTKLTSMYMPVISLIVTADAELQKARMELDKVMSQSDHFLVYSLRPILCYMTFANWVATKVGYLSGDPSQAFYAFGLVFGIFGSSRGIEKIMKVFKAKEEI